MVESRNRIGIALQFIQLDAGLVVAGQLTASVRNAAFQRRRTLTLHLSLSFQVRHDALDFGIDLAVDVFELTLRLEDVGVQRTIARFKIGQVLRDRGALRAEILDDIRMQGFADIVTRRTGSELALGDGQAGFAFGLIDLDPGQLLVERRDFSLGDAVVVVRRQQAIGDTILLHGGFGRLDLTTQVGQARAQPVIGFLGRLIFGFELLRQVQTCPLIGDLGSLVRRLRGEGHRDDAGDALTLDGQVVQDVVDDLLVARLALKRGQGRQRHGLVDQTAQQGRIEFRVLLEVQRLDDTFGQGVRLQDLCFGIDGRGVGRQAGQDVLVGRCRVDRPGIDHDVGRRRVRRRTRQHRNHDGDKGQQEDCDK